MSDHIPRDVLSALASGALSAERLPALLPHVRVCRPCFLAFLAALGRAGRPQPSPEQNEAYESALSRVFGKVRQAARQAKGEKERTAKLLARLEQGGLAALPAVLRPGWEIPVIEALLARSWALRHEAPADMVELAEFARMACRRLSSALRGAEHLADLRCRVGLTLGNAYRIADKLDAAEEAFDEAMVEYLQGTGDKLLLARFLDLRSSLHRARRELAAARTTLRLVVNIYRRHGERPLAGRALIKMGILTGHAGQPEKALRLIERGLSMVDESGSEDLVFTGIHNRLWLLVDCGRVEEARRTLFLNRWRYAAAGGQLTALKLCWLEARIDAGLGKLARAEAGFREVREGMNALGHRYDGALATFDLAAMVLRAGRTGDAHDLVMEAVEIFLALGIRREALAAVLFLRECFEQRLSTVAVLEEVTAFLRRAQHDPGVRFEPSDR
jgi:tetratricopeptide (TPR) repeat protein